LNFGGLRHIYDDANGRSLAIFLVKLRNEGINTRLIGLYIVDADSIFLSRQTAGNCFSSDQSKVSHLSDDLMESNANITRLEPVTIAVRFAICRSKLQMPPLQLLYAP
jgi:hypothetical protein